MTKKKPKKSADPQSKADKPRPFNAPFAELKGALKQAARQAAAPPPLPPVEGSGPEEAGAVDLFAKAMSDVARLGEAERRRVVAGGESPPRLVLPPDDDLEVMAHLADLVSGAADFDIRHSDKYLEGSLPGVGEALMERLRQGAFPLQDHLDLHGLSAEQAFHELSEFFARSAAKGYRHVLVVHGKGKSSPFGMPVLRTLLPLWLEKKSFRRLVLAFCTAQPLDGGSGAMYVLLRRWSGPRKGWI
ncbi:MAG: Smr/MutS family protein [Deltaproteobacteria bacterium]|nr:Smr/MutS family protein [Deltaproteobacteria bacterium]